MILSTFLIICALFFQFIRNSLHLSEPPLAVPVGITVGPSGLDLITRLETRRLYFTGGHAHYRRHLMFRRWY
jgi:NhaP-type Na+/H+ or K+/H+ antiporter